MIVWNIDVSAVTDYFDYKNVNHGCSDNLLKCLAFQFTCEPDLAYIYVVNEPLVVMIKFSLLLVCSKRLI